MSATWGSWCKTKVAATLAGKKQRQQNRSRAAGQRSQRPRLEHLEGRELPAGTWTGLANLAPGPIGTMMLLSDGTVMAQNMDFSTPANRNRWYRLTPSASGGYANGTWSNLASMNLQRLYYGSNVLPDGRVLVLGGEYSGSSGAQNFTNTGEIYNPVSNTWTNIANFPQSQFGDDPTQLLPDGRVLAGYLNAANTYIYNPSTNSWSATGSKLRSDRSDEETWLKLPDDSILSYDVFTEGQGGTNHAQRYIPSSGTWVDAGNVPTALSGGNPFGFELGGAVRLPDGRVWVLGANSHTAFYTPSTNTWVAGPNIPNNGSGQLQGADDAPVAMLPDGKVLLAVDHPLFNGPTNVYEFDPATNGFTNVTPSVSGMSTSGAVYTDRMLMLPNGQVLYTTGGNKLAVYTPAGTPNAAWRSAVSTISGAGTTMTLTGSLLNGISQGASYGDDAEMDTNYPIVQYQSNFSYARTANWSSTGVATGTTTVQFTVPSRGIYGLNVIANGIASPTILNVEMTSSTDNLVIRNNPSNSAIVQVVSGSTVLAETAISGISKIIVTCDGNADTLAVSYQYGNPLPANGLEYAFGAGVDTLNVNDTTTTTNQTFTLGTNSVQRSGSAPITFLNGGINFVNVNGGSGNNTYQINNTEPSWTTTVNTGTGVDTVNILASSGPLNINGGNTETVNIGNNGSVAGILGAVSLENEPSFDTVNINDQNDATSHTATIDTVTRSGDSSLGRLQGIGAAPITWDYFDTAAVNLNFGSGTATVNVLGTGVTTNVFNVAAATVNVGSANSIAGIQGTLNLENEPSFDTVNINDQADTTSHVATIDTVTRSGDSSLGRLTGIAAAITWDYLDTTAVNLNLGSGDAAVNVLGTGVTTNINNFAAATVNIGNAGSLTGILGAVTLFNGPSYDQVTIDGSADSANNAVTIGSGGVTGLSPAPLNFTAFSTSALTVNGGSGNSTYTITDTPVAFFGAMTLNTGAGGNLVTVRGTSTPLTINTGFGDAVNLTSAGNTLDPIGAVTVNDPTGTSAVTVDDSGYGGSDSYVVTSSTVTIGRSSAFSLTYGGIGALTLNGGPGSNVFYIDSTSAATTVNAGGGGNIFRISPFTQYLAATILGPSLTLNGGGGDILEFFDAGDPNVEGFNFDPVPQSLVLDSTGTDITDFFGMGGGVYAVTNGFSNENDASGTVIFDPSGGPPGGSGDSPAATQRPSHQASAQAADPAASAAGKPATERGGAAEADRLAAALLSEAASDNAKRADLIDQVFSS